MTRIPFALLAAAGVLILAFQNFSYVPLEPLKPRRVEQHLAKIQTQSHYALNIEDTHSRGFDIRDLAPSFRDTSSAPLNQNLISSHASTNESHTKTADMKSVGQQLFEREFRPSLRPLEKEWVGRVNRYLAGFVPVDGEDWPETGSGEEGADGSDRAPAGQPAFPGLPAGFPGLPGSSSEDDATDDSGGGFSWKTYRPQNIRLTKANEISVAFAHQTSLSCEIGSGGSKFRVSRPLSATSSIDFHHETEHSRNSLGFNLSW